MTKTPEALKYFRRYSKFYLKGIEEEDKNICWRVEATDSISMPGILQVVAVEYFANETRDDLDNSLVDGLVMEPVDPNAETKIDDLIQRLLLKLFHRQIKKLLFDEYLITMDSLY